MHQIVFYTTERDDSPIDDFMDELDIKARAKVEAYLSLLAEHGPNLKRPYADHVRGKIKELAYTTVQTSIGCYTFFT